VVLARQRAAAQKAQVEIILYLALSLQLAAAVAVQKVIQMEFLAALAAAQEDRELPEVELLIKAMPGFPARMRRPLLGILGAAVEALERLVLLDQEQLEVRVALVFRRLLPVLR
jgi:hypothetical protein